MDQIGNNAAAARALAEGGLVIVLDPAAANGAGRGFFLHQAALATTGVVNTTIVHGRGLTCFSVRPGRALRLGLTLSGERRGGDGDPVFLRTVEAADCHGTGISAADRALTLRAAGSPEAGIGALKSPGHVVPCLVPDGAVTGSVPALACRVLEMLTGHDVAAWTDILDDDGELANADWCAALAGKLGLALLDAPSVLRLEPAA
jgi:3,4-dihydroxy 2-butanone 4-phosphate synthase/GTP cyclohydrolase II